MPTDPLADLFDANTPRDRVHRIAAKANIPADVADDYLKTTQVESGHNVNVRPSAKGALGFGQVMPDVKGGSVRTVGGRQYNLKNPDENIEAGLRYFHEGGSDPVARRLYYFGGPGARRTYQRTGRIPAISDGNMSAAQYVKATGGQQQQSSDLSDLFDKSAQTQEPRVEELFDAPEPPVTPPATGRFAAMANVTAAAPVGRYQREVAPVRTRAAVTSTVRDPDEAAPTIKPMDFQAASPWQSHPTTDISRATLGPADLLGQIATSEEQGGTVEQQMVQRRLEEQKHGHFGTSGLVPGGLTYLPGDNLNPSTQLAKPVKVPFSPHLNPTREDVVKGYLTALGPEYAKYGEQYRQQTGRDILSLSTTDVDRDKEGNFYVQPSQGAIRVLNAYVGSGGKIDAAQAEAAKIAAERSGAVDKATKAAQPDIAAIEAERKAQGAIPDAQLAPFGIAKTSGRVATAPLGRFVADLGKTVGGLTSLGGLTPNQVSDYFNRQGEITKLGASMPPLTPEGKEIERTMMEKGGTIIGDLGFTVGELVLLKKATGLRLGQIFAIKTALTTSDEPARVRAPKIAQNYAMGELLESGLGRITTGGIFAIPTAVEGAQAATRGQKKWGDVGLESAMQAGIGLAMGGAHPVESVAENPLGIDRAFRESSTTVPDINAELAARESAVKPTFLRDDAGNPVARLLNPEEVVAGAKPKVRPIHLADTRPRDPSGRFTEISPPASEATNPAEPATRIPVTPTPQSASEGVTQVTPSSPEVVKPPLSQPKLSPPPEVDVTYSKDGSAIWFDPKTGAMRRIPADRLAVSPKVESSVLSSVTPEPEVFRHSDRTELVRSNEAPRSPKADEYYLDNGNARRAVWDWEPGDGTREILVPKSEWLAKQQSKSAAEADALLKKHSLTPEQEAILKNRERGRNEISNRVPNQSTTTTSEAVPSVAEPAQSRSERGVPSRVNAAEQAAGADMVVPSAERPAVETPKETIAEPSTTSARQQTVAADRAALDLPELPPAERKSWRASLDNAKPERASVLADEVLRRPRPLNDEETASLVVRAQEIKNQHAEAMKQIGDATDPEDIAAGRAQAEALQREFDKITEATKKSGSEKGRALASQKLTINQDFDLISVKQRMKAAKGRELTEAESKKYADMVAERDKAIVDRDAALERAHTLELQRQITRQSRQRKRSETKESLDTEAATIRTNIAAEFARLKSTQSSTHSLFGLGNIDPEGVITKELIKYARNRVKANVGLNAEALIDEVHDLVKDFASRRQVAEILSGYMKPQNARQIDEATRQLSEIRKEIKVLLAKEDVAAGVRTERIQGPRKSDINQLPKVGPRQSEARRLPMEGPRLSDARQLPAEGPTLSEGVGRKAGPRFTDAPAQGPPKQLVTRNTIRLKQLQAKEAELAAKMAAGDYSKAEKPPPQPYNREVNAAQIRVKQIERVFNEEAAKRVPQGLADYLIRWKRFAVLGFPSTIGKLGTAATGRMAATPLYELAGEGMRRVPGLKSTFADVPRATLAGERAAISQLWQSESFKDVLRHLKGGDDMISLLYGENGGDEFISRSSLGNSLMPKSYDELMDRPGHLHAAVKVIPKRAAMFRAFENLMAREQRLPNGRDVGDPAVQLALMAEAYPEAQRAILQQRGPVSNLFNNVIQSAARSDYRIARGLGKVLQFQYPITKVPANFVGESALHVIGLPAGLAEVATRGATGRIKAAFSESRSETMRKIAARLPDAVSDLKPEERARIARSLKIGGVGLGFVAWGAMRPDQFGGYYQPGKREGGDVKAGGMRFMGLNIPRWMGHIPPLEAAQFGATLRRVYDSMKAKEKSKGEAVKESSIAAAKGMAEEIPFVDSILNTKHGLGVILGKEGERTKFIGGQAVAMSPGFLRQGAKTLDYPKDGTLIRSLNPFSTQEPVARKEDTVGQIIAGGIPGLRQAVPVKNTAGKLLESRSGDDPASSEMTRLGVQLNGAQRSKDESPADFAARQRTVDATLRKELDTFIASRRYRTMGDKERSEWIKSLPDRVNAEYQRQQPRTIRPLKSREPRVTLSP